jgi:ABC-type bacteriocin/lantibiotic exporter with double-glycine peptidase domain
MGAEHELDFVLRFTDMACFTSVVESLPKKFDSSIQEKGVNLSGGQQQRLALSRGLLACHDKDIILLDEPTSSLDTITEISVYQNIFKGFSGKTIISTIHQLHLLPLFDRVCVFDKGQIIASGTLQELLSSCPKFVSLWEAMQRAAAGNTTVAGK